MREPNGWKGWMLGISGVLIMLLIGILLKVVGAIIEDAKSDHRQILERLQKLEVKRGDR